MHGTITPLQNHLCASRFRRRLEPEKADVNPLEPAFYGASSIFRRLIKSFFFAGSATLHARVMARPCWLQAA